ncbi:hypothetical protein ACFV0Y_16650 [Streptomyces sp. NPDC059569]|uniref:hypothetical protein n=1 Tax=Streptomyces sp. NPDC059569 TaxID=3346869 RepID=UPI0036A33E8B
MLMQLRHRLHLPAHLTYDLFPEGWTETVSQGLIKPDGVWDLVCEEAGRIQMAGVVGAFRPVAHRPTVHHRRTKGDTPKYSSAARTLAAEAARKAQKIAPGQTVAKNRTAEQN